MQEHYSVPKSSLIQLVEERSISWAVDKGCLATYPLQAILPDHLNTKHLKYLSLYEQRLGLLQTVPKFLSTLINLEYLHLPSYTLEVMRPEDLPPNLKAINVYGYDFQLPDDLVFSNLKHFLTTDLQVTFESKNLPCVKELAIRCNKKAILQSIAALGGLQILVTGPVNASTFFEVISSLPLRHLSIGPGSLSDLGGIEQLAKLRSLRIAGFHKLTTLEHLSLLPQLEDLFIQNSKPLPDLSPLIRCSHLKRLDFLNCGALNWNETRDALLNRLEALND